MTDRNYNALFLCTANSARSILAEAILNHRGAGRFHAYSAGSYPNVRVNPHARALLERMNLPTDGLRSKSWNEFAAPGAPPLYFAFTVCDDAAGEVCPAWPGQPMAAHWGIPDPAAVEGSDFEKTDAFREAFRVLDRRIELFTSLPLASLDPMALDRELRAIGRHWRGIGVTLFVNWAVKPFSMALLGWLFIAHLFRPWLPEDQVDAYIAGLILLAAAPCTAMVFVWSNLADGEPHFTLSQVALNDTIMVFAFAPIVGLLLGLSAITVPWETLLLSVGLYIVVPVAVAQLLRRLLLAGGTALLAVPILIQVYLNAGIAYLLNRTAGEAHNVAAPSALIGASNFFELAVAAALATGVGVLIEVPAMLTVVQIVNRSRGWYERGPRVAASASLASDSQPPSEINRRPAATSS